MSLLHLGYVCLRLLPSWHNGTGMRAAPSQQGWLQWPTGHANGFSLYQKPPGGAEGPWQDDSVASGPCHGSCEVERAEIRCALDIGCCCSQLPAAEWSLRKCGAAVLKVGSTEQQGIFWHLKGTTVKKRCFCSSLKDFWDSIKIKKNKTTFGTYVCSNIYKI